MAINAGKAASDSQGEAQADIAYLQRQPSHDQPIGRLTWTREVRWLRINIASLPRRRGPTGYQDAHLYFAPSETRIREPFSTFQESVRTTEGRIPVRRRPSVLGSINGQKLE